MDENRQPQSELSPTNDPSVFDLSERHFSQESSPMGAMLEVSRMLSRALELDEVLPRALQVAEFTLGAAASSVILKDDESGKLRFHVVDGELAGRLKSLELEQGKGIAGWVLEHGEAQLVPDAYRDHRFDREVDKQTGFRTKSILCVPLQVGAKRIGVVQVLNRLDGQPFSMNDLGLLEMIATPIALAIENAREHRLRVESERLAVIGQTISSLGHCVKNALQGLQSGSYLIDNALREIESSSMKRAWNMLQKHVNFLGDLVMDMLSYAKKRQPVYAPVDLSEVCESCVELLGPRAKEHSVELLLHLCPSATSVMADSSGLRRCLNNLVSNAIDACEGPSGVVTITTESFKDPDVISITVEDTGKGIPEQELSRVFDVFYSTKGNKGTGLGLPVCKKIVDEHGGTIEVASLVGQGTRFTILLPQNAQAPKQQGGSY